MRGHPFGRWTIGVAFPAAKLAVEVDGWAWHMDVERFRADRHNGKRAGTGPLEPAHTWHDLANRPDDVISEIRAALAATARTA